MNWRGTRLISITLALFLQNIVTSFHVENSLRKQSPSTVIGTNDEQEVHILNFKNRRNLEYIKYSKYPQKINIVSNVNARINLDQPTEDNESTHMNDTYSILENEKNDTYKRSQDNYNAIINSDANNISSSYSIPENLGLTYLSVPLQNMNVSFETSRKSIESQRNSALTETFQNTTFKLRNNSMVLHSPKVIYYHKKRKRSLFDAIDENIRRAERYRKQRATMKELSGPIKRPSLFDSTFIQTKANVPSNIVTKRVERDEPKESSVFRKRHSPYEDQTGNIPPYSGQPIKPIKILLGSLYGTSDQRLPNNDLKNEPEFSASIHSYTPMNPVDNLKLIHHQRFTEHHWELASFHLKEAYKHQTLQNYHAGEFFSVRCALFGICWENSTHDFHPDPNSVLIQEKKVEIMNDESDETDDSGLQNIVEGIQATMKNVTSDRSFNNVSPRVLPIQQIRDLPNAHIQDPEVTPGLLQGDIALTSLQDLLRVGVNWMLYPEKKWNNNTVPYAISPLYQPPERVMIETAVSIISFFSCVQFEPWDGRAKDYILIWPVENPKGCWSYVGKSGGQQVVALERPNERSRRCFESVGKPIHELLHALGVYHEHTRGDRDDYVSIVPENILSNFWGNFAKQRDASSPYPYDYDSVMHYGRNFFSKDGRSSTLIPKDPEANIGQRTMLSTYDCLKLNHMYGCLDLDQYHKDMYTELCTQLAL